MYVCVYVCVCMCMCMHINDLVVHKYKNKNSHLCFNKINKICDSVIYK